MSNSRSSNRRADHCVNSSPIAWQTRETVDVDSAASAPSASARVFCTSRTDRPRTNPAITSDSNALDLVTDLPNSVDANASVVPRNFGRATVNRPGRGLDRRLAIAVPAARPGIWTVGGSLVAGPTQEHLDLGLYRHHDQPGTQAGDVLEDLR